MRAQPSREQLLEALRLSGLQLSLEVALQSRSLAIALENTAIAQARRPVFQNRRPIIDHKRRAAGDND